MNDMNESHSQDPQQNKQTETSAPPQKTASVISRSRYSKRKLLLVVAIVVGCIVSAFAGAEIRSLLMQQTGTVTSRETTQNDGNKVVTQEEEDIANVVSKVSPSVVSILTKSQSVSRLGDTTSEDGAGTGIIVGKDGYILTNKHVIDGASTVQVVTSDGTTYDNVKVLGSDPLNDVAYLKIPDVSDLPVAELGDSTSVRVGQKVIAIGNSLGQYQNTVTSGIISGTGRPISAQAGDSVESLTDLIQTDAAINPGNSGGPLLNLQGQVIGLNTAIVEDAQGIGFSIPISATKGILKGVLKGGDVQRAYLGVSYIPITAEVAKQYNLSVKKGAYVFSGSDKTAIVSGSPADKAGIKDKDIITKVGDIEVGDRGSVSSLVAEYAPGDTIALTILRDGKTMTVNVTLTAYKG
jgi:S1-C subfamily serine protease